MSAREPVTIVDHLDARAAETPERLAFDVAGHTRTCGALAEASHRAAAGFMQAGLLPGERVGLALGTVPELLALLFGAQRLGAVPVILNPALPEEAIVRRAAIVGARLVVDPAQAERLCAAAPTRLEYRAAPNDLAFLQITSGTSGDPHAAAITHRALIASLTASRALLEPRPDDVLASWVPLHHDLGLVRFVFLPVFVGLPCYLLPPSLAHLGAWLQTMARVRATITGAPDFAYRLAARMVDPTGLDLSALRVATNGGEPVRASTVAAFEARFGLRDVVRPGYGLAEATLGVASLRPGEPLRVDAAGHVSCGRPLAGIDVRVVDGAIEVKGDVLFSGYYGDEAATRAAFTPDGWLRTGDVGRLDDEGYLWVLGRARAMIKRAGALIAPREIEEAADRVAGVRFSAAVGLPGEGTEEVVVVVETRPELLDDEAARADLVHAVSEAVLRAIGVAPGEVVVAPPRTIPITVNGKIRHAALRDDLVAQRAARAASAT